MIALNKHFEYQLLTDLLEMVTQFNRTKLENLCYASLCIDLFFMYSGDPFANTLHVVVFRFLPEKQSAGFVYW